jgi:type IV pilus modification protein PilV
MMPIVIRHGNNQLMYPKERQIFIIKPYPYGFTIIEILITLVILSIGMLGLTEISYVAMKGNIVSRQYTIAATLAQDKMEELKNKPYTDSDLSDINTNNNTDLQSTTNTDYQESNIDEKGNPGGIYTRTINIADNIPNNGMKTIVVIVTWTDAQQQARKLSLSTIKSP